MFTEVELLEQENIVEAILFMMGDSIGLDTIAVALNTDKDTAKAACERLVEKYENEYKDRGMKVIRINNKYQMVSNNKYFTNLVAVASRPKKPVLTDAILETLSIIAYKQPITKPEIENIRGVKSDFACNKLLEYGLIEEQGRLDAPGRPIILGTTEEFLLRFGIETTADLPILDADRIAEIENEVEKELSESLGEPVFIERSVSKENETSVGDSNNVESDTSISENDISNGENETSSDENDISNSENVKSSEESDGSSPEINTSDVESLIESEVKENNSGEQQ